MTNTYTQNLANILSQIDSQLCGLYCSKKRVFFEYSKQRKIISNIFSATDASNHPLPYDVDSIIVRLRLIDSFYSTGGRYSYLAIEELADAIYNNLGSSEKNAADLFYSFVINSQNKSAVQKLFESRYGVHKNLNRGARQFSLLSKYAFFQLLKYGVKSYKLGFPIYDSMAINTYPSVCVLLDTKTQKGVGKSMNQYIDALHVLLNEIQCKSGYNFQNQAFDVLDQYLWRIGKMMNGSYTLLLDKSDYNIFIRNIGMSDSELNASSKPTFNQQVVEVCKQKKMAAIKGISSKLFIDIYQHWLSYFAIHE